MACVRQGLMSAWNVHTELIKRKPNVFGGIADDREINPQNTLKVHVQLKFTCELEFLVDFAKHTTLTHMQPLFLNLFAASIALTA